MAGTAWATMALLATIEHRRNPSSLGSKKAPRGLGASSWGAVRHLAWDETARRSAFRLPDRESNGRFAKELR